MTGKKVTLMDVVMAVPIVAVGLGLVFLGGFLFYLWWQIDAAETGVLVSIIWLFCAMIYFENRSGK